MADHLYTIEIYDTHHNKIFETQVWGRDQLEQVLYDNTAAFGFTKVFINRWLTEVANELRYYPTLQLYHDDEYQGKIVVHDMTDQYW